MRRIRRPAVLAAVLMTLSAVVTVIPGTASASPADQLEITTSLPGNAVAGQPFDITVTAEDTGDEVVTDYDGTVAFSSSDGGATLPAGYPFTAGDNGTHTFSNGATLMTPGEQTITVDDGAVNAEIQITVDAAADLSVTVTPSPDGSEGNDVVAGNDETFTVDVFNDGPSDSGTYTLSLQVEGLDDGKTTVVTAPDGCEEAGDDTLSCERSGILANEHDAFDVTMHIASSYANPDNSASLTYGASVSDQAVQDLVPDNDSTEPSELTVVRKADLGIDVETRQASASPFDDHDAVAGTEQLFEMTVSNGGPSDNGDFTATLTVGDYDDSNLTLVSADGCTGTPGDGTTPGTVECPSSGTLARDDSTTFSITFEIAPSYTNPEATRQLTYSATLTDIDPADQGADEAQDSTGTLTLDVDSVADLSDVGIDQTAFETSLTVAQFQPTNPGNLNTVLYTVKVTNHGPSDAQDVVLTETLPSTLQTNKIKVCDTGATCTPATPYGNGDDVPLGLIPLDGSRVVRFEAPLVQGPTLRRGAAGTLMSGNAASVVTSDATDPDDDNNTNDLDINLFTVPNAPIVLQAQPGNGEIGLLWKVPADGGSTITDYDFILDGTSVTTVPATSSALKNGFCAAPDTCLTYQLAATNGTHTVKIEARNAAGDSDPSATFTVVPCASCVIDQLTNSRTFLLSSNNASKVITPSTPGFASWFTNGCFPQSTNTSAPGATTSDPKVSCLDIPAGVASSKVGALIALHDEPSINSGTGLNKDCPNPDGNHPCLGNQTVVSVPPGTGLNQTFSQVIIYDRTISSKKFGDPCTATPCGKKYAYIVYMRPSASDPAVAIGSTVPGGVTVGGTSFPAWCPTAGGNPVIPPGKTACVVSYVILQGNSNPNPFPNGNTSNGSEGNGDLRLTILFRGDPRTAP